jgi:DNA-binding XRE family transcriptional regulator
MKRLKKAEGVKEKDFRLGRHIQKMRQAAGLTQWQLAEKIKVSYQFIALIETGRKVPNIHLLNKIAKALNIKVSELIPF